MSPPSSSGWRSKVRPIFGIVAFGAMLYSAVSATLPNVVSDWQVRKEAQAAVGGRLVEGKCSSYAVLHICNADLSIQTKAGPVARHVQFVFSGFHLGDYSARIVADPTQPELATTDLALDKLLNRTITLAIAFVLIVSVIVGLVWGLVTG